MATDRRWFVLNRNPPHVRAGVDGLNHVVSMMSPGGGGGGEDGWESLCDPGWAKWRPYGAGEVEVATCLTCLTWAAL